MIAENRWVLTGRITGSRRREGSARFRQRCFRSEWHVDGEDAAFAGHVADPDVAAVGPYRLSGNRQSKAEARSIAPAAVAKYLKQIALALRNPAALIFGLDQ